MVEPPDLGLSGVDQIVQDQQPGKLLLFAGCGSAACGSAACGSAGCGSAGFVGSRPLELGEVLQMTKGCGPLGLDEASHIDTRHSDGQGQLDDELIAGGVTAVDRDRPPTLDLVATLVGQPIGDPALIVRPAGALDQPVRVV